MRALHFLHFAADGTESPVYPYLPKLSKNEKVTFPALEAERKETVCFYLASYQCG